jgi:putative flippase GtrA
MTGERTRRLATALPRLAGREGRTFARFCVVGGTGFLTDAGLLAFLVHGLGLGPFMARAISFAVAVTATWLLNRHWAFAACATSFWRGFLTYLGVQGLGLGCNMLVYVLWILLLPPPFDEPLAALFTASSAALLVNYTGMRMLVFTTSGHKEDRPPRQGSCEKIAER